MRKLTLLVISILLLFFVPANAQQRELRGRVTDDASTSCEADKLQRAGGDGKLPLACLPTSTGVLEWFIRGNDLAVAATSMVQKGLPSFSAGTVVHLGCAACVSLSDCSTAASATINLDARAFSTQHTAGTDLHTSEFTCDQNGLSTTTFAGDASNAANEVWNLSISAVTSATILRVWVTVERTE